MKYLKYLFLITLLSCNGLPPAKHIDVERCFVTLNKSIVLENETYFSGDCRCHTYRVGEEIKRISESVNKPLSYCDKQASFKNYATTLYLYLEEWRIFLLQQ